MESDEKDKHSKDDEAVGVDNLKVNHDESEDDGDQATEEGEADSTGEDDQDGALLTDDDLLDLFMVRSWIGAGCKANACMTRASPDFIEPNFNTCMFTCFRPSLLMVIMKPSRTTNSNSSSSRRT